MTDYTVAAGKVARHGINMTAAQADTVTFADNIGSVDVMSDGTANVYYTVDGSTPTVGGSNCYRLPSGMPGIDTRDTRNDAGIDVVKLIADGATVVSVQVGG